MSKFNLNAYYLRQYVDTSSGTKVATLSLERVFPSLGVVNPIGNIVLDEEDIEYLSKKYTISELKIKEMELGELLDKLNKVQEEIKFLKEKEV